MRVTTRIEKRIINGHAYWMFVLKLTVYLSNGKILSMQESRDALIVVACRYDYIEEVKNEMKKKAFESMQKANTKAITRKEYRNAGK